MWRESLILSWWHFVECCIFQELKNNASPCSNPFLSLNLSFKLLQQQQSVDMRASLCLWKRSTRLPVSLFDCLLVNQYGIALSLVSLSVCSSVFVCMPVSLLVVFLFVCRSVCQSLTLSLCSSFWLSLDLCLSVCPSGCLFFCLSVCVTFCLFACVSVFLLVYLPLCSFNYLFYEPLFLSVFLPECPSVFLSDSLFVFLFVYLSLCLSFCLSVRLCSYLLLSLSLCVCLPVCLSVCLYFCLSLTVYQFFPYVCWAVCL